MCERECGCCLADEIADVRSRQDAQDAELEILRRGIRNVIAVAATAQGNIDTIIDLLGKLAYGRGTAEGK